MINNYTRWLWLWCAVFFLSTKSFAASPSDSFLVQAYDNYNGLSNSSINDLHIDKDGLLWLGTWDGLNMFEGNRLRIFNYNLSNDQQSIGGNIIQGIDEDKAGNLWITTVGGITRYDKKEGRFYNFFYQQNLPGNITEHEYKIAIDQNGQVFCYTHRQGLTRYNLQQNKFENIPGTASLKVKKITFDNSNRLIILTENDQLQLWVSNTNALRLSHSIQNNVANFFLVNGQLFFTKSNDEYLYRLDQVATALVPLSGAINSIVYYNNHYLVAWATGGCTVFNNTWQSTRFMSGLLRSLANIRITSWALKNETLWAGTDGSGVIKITPQTKFFGTVTMSKEGSAYNRPVRAFCEDGQQLWVATKGRGIITYNNILKEQELKNITAPQYLDNNAVYALKKGIDNLIYMGTDGNGLNIYDIKRNQFFKWSDILNKEGCPGFGSVYSIYQDPDSSVWVGTSGYGLLHLRFSREEDGKIKFVYGRKYSAGEKDKGPANNIIYSLTPYDNDHIWVGCRYGGLSLLNKKTGRFRTFKAFTYEGSLSNNDIIYIHKDKRNILWIGTSYGLNFLPPDEIQKSNPVFGKITTEKGLPNNTIHAITEDDEGNIWISSNKGIAKITWPNLSVSNYQQTDGLQSSEFSDGAVWKDKTGKLYFGGISGFNSFLPAQISKSNYLGNILISYVTAGNHSSGQNSLFVFQNNNAATPLSYTTPRDENYISLEASAINFANAEKFEISYFLEGYDHTWNAQKATAKISYSNLPPGNYELKVKWNNGEGLSSDEITVLQVKVQPYPWLSIWAFVVYALIISFAIYTLYSYRKRRAAIKQQLKLEQLMRLKEEEVHENRIGFFTNIAHELQTPLTLIMGGFERFMEKADTLVIKGDKGKYLSLIKQQTAKLTYLLHQLFEFRKADTGYTQNNFSYLNLTALLTNIVEPFAPLAEKRKLEYDYHISGNMMGWMDKDKLEKILFNLLSNAFKYTSKGERIIFQAAQREGLLYLEVFNSGVQLPQDQLRDIFRKFYTGDNIKNAPDTYGTGIGLAFTSQLVNLLEGTIIAENRGDGVCFTTTIPLKNNSQQVEDHPVADATPSELFTVMTSDSVAHPANIGNKTAAMEEILNADKDIVVIVDDEAEIRYLLRDVLKKDYIVYEAEDGQQAAALINTYMPSLVIADILMPKLNGLELCKLIKETPATCQIPVILLSARSMEEQHIEGYEAGADAYISKPFNTSNLKVRVRKLIEYQKRIQQLFKNADNSNATVRDAGIKKDDKAFLEQLTGIIREEILNPELNAALLEKTIFLSKMQLYRKTKSLTGMTPGEFIKHTRLAKAADLLVHTNMPVGEVFLNSGFNNESYFFREFKKRYECAPQDYRKNSELKA
ncbi:two-component regulator propeller domain-containing protein [Niabella sp. CJ426]|uniref:hybrid sensor histidine kinase/response regulator n=1 Tax=Niabella sp. CJ426 TaxID=3393740 RepID=UPI003D007AA7